MERSGTPLEWEEDPTSGEQAVSVRLRHFNSGRLLQIILYKDETKMNQVLTLATGRSGELEEDGEGTSSRKVLKKGGRIQNYTFKLINRATVEESTLSRETVANIRNEATGAFISTQEVKQGPARTSDEPDDRPISPVESDQEESPASTPAP